MKLHLYIYFLFTYIMVTVNAHAENLNEKYIHEFLVAVDEMSVNKNVAGIGEFLSDDVVITMHISVLGNLQTHTANKEQYLAMLAQGWEIAENYKYSRKGVEIKYLDEGKKALITATVYESMIVEGTAIRSTSTEAVIVERQNGKTLIIKMTGETSM